MKVVINRCYGGFGLSKEAVKRGRELNAEWAFKIPFKGEKYPDGEIADDFYGTLDSDKYRTDPKLVLIVEQLGAAANDRYSNLKVVEIPDDVDWEIRDYDGFESVHEVHRSWY